MASHNFGTEPNGCMSRAYASIPGKREYSSRISALSVDFEQVHIVSRRRGVSSSGSVTRASSVDGSSGQRRPPPSFPFKQNSWVLDPADEREPCHSPTLLQQDSQRQSSSAKPLSFEEGASLTPTTSSRDRGAQGYSPQQSKHAYRLSPKCGRRPSASTGATNHPHTTTAAKPAGSQRVKQSLRSQTLPKRSTCTINVARSGKTPFDADEERIPGDGCDKEQWQDEDALEEDPDVLSDLDQEESEEEEEEEEGVFFSDSCSSGGGAEGRGPFLRKASSSDSSGVWSDASTQDHPSRGLW